MISFVCFKWKPQGAYRSTFGPATVNTLRSMVARHYQRPHRFFCVTDDPLGIDKRTKVIPLWSDHALVPSPHGRGNPSCYRRLKLFSPWAQEVFGEQIVSLDLDCVITSDITSLFETSAEFKIWGDTARGTPYNGSLFYLRTGTRTKVWETFDPVRSPALGRKLGYIGSDQAWLGACLGPNEAKWTAADGVFSFRNQIQPPRGTGLLPKAAKIVMFHGAFDPWMLNVQARYPWVKEHYK